MAPCIDGHFPGNPIVPGAVLLGFAADALSQEGWEIAEVTRVKFLRPLRPVIPFRIEITLANCSASISWLAGDVLIAQAKMVLRGRRG